MDNALLVARIALALVFAVAGLAKLADLAGSRKAITGFGLPAALAGPLGVLLPLGELAVAVALIPTATAWWGAVGALALLLLFIAGISVNLARGRKPDCHCFGQIYSSPAGWSTLVRNGVLAALAGFIVWEGRDNPGRSVASWLGGLTGAEQMGLLAGLAGLAALAALGWLLLSLLRQNGRLLMRIEALEGRLDAGGTVPTPAEAQAEPEPGLPLGAPAPDFSLSGLHGETLTLGALRAAGKPVMLVFSDPNCGPCTTLLPELGRWQRDYSARLTTAVISRGTSEANRAKSAEHGLTHVLLQQDREVAEAYQTAGTPSAVIVRPDGTIGSPLAGGVEAIRALVTRTMGTAAGAPATAPAPTVPAPSAAVPTAPARNGNGSGNIPLRAVPAAAKSSERTPALMLPDLSGKMVDLADFRGSKTLVLFWNPGCGYCRRMLDDLKAWETDPPADAPRLLVVSTGTAEANEAMGLRSPVVLDQGFNVGRTFGASGTPSAVLVDEQGRVASDVAVGATSVLAILGGEQTQPSASSAPAARPPALKIGDPAPELRLPDLNGKMVDLARFRGSKTLVLFWNLECGFCARMLDDLKAWEANRPKGAPKLLVVSTGSVEANKAMGLRSPVVLTQGMDAGSKFGANGTPMAVLIDERGRIASELAAGAPAVLELARGEQDRAKTVVA